MFSVIKIDNYGWATDRELIDNKFLNVIGFAVYAYEGIGVVIPVMEITEKQDVFPKVLFAVITTVFILYLAFGLFCFFVYGSALATPLITSNLPPTNPVSWVIKILFCFNLIFSYPLVIYPANMIIESYLFGKMPFSTFRKWLKNLYRTIMVGFTVIIALLLGNALGSFLALLGAFSCTPIAFTLPALFHYKLVAKTGLARTVDLLLIIVSLFIMIFCSAFSIYTWNG